MPLVQQQISEILSEIVKAQPGIQSTDYKWLSETLREQLCQSTTDHDLSINKEINGLANCLFWGIVDDIRHSYSNTLDLSETKNILHQLIRDFGQQEDLARWCIESWCDALGKKVDVNAVSSIDIHRLIPSLKLPSSNSEYSECLFKDVVFEEMKNKELDLDSQLELTVKGKQLGLSDGKIKSIIDKAQILVIEYKKKVEELARIDLIKKEQDKLRDLKLQQEEERIQIHQKQIEERKKIELQKLIEFQEIQKKELARKVAADEDELIRKDAEKEFYKQGLFVLIAIVFLMIIGFVKYFISMNN